MLPCIIFFFALLAIGIIILGFNNILSFYESLPTNGVLLTTSGFIFILIICSYSLHALRDSLLRFWSGSTISFAWLFWGFESREMKRFIKERKRAESYQYAIDTIEKEFIPDILEFYQADEQKPPIPTNERKSLLSSIERLSLDPLEVKYKDVLENVYSAYERFAVDSLSDVYESLRHWHEIFKIKNQARVAFFDRSFGSVGTIRGTALGNIIQSYNEYCAKRYNIEAEIFWPRLQSLLNDWYKGQIDDQRNTLDFAVISCTLSCVFSLVCLAGPFIYSSDYLWWIVISGGFVVGHLYYRMAISAADTLGHLVRTCYDLYRLKLIKELSLEFPTTTANERSLWTKYSQFVTFGGTAVDLNLKDYDKENP